MTKRKARRSPVQPKKETPDALRQSGLRAFRRDDYTEAIVNWEFARRQDPASVPSAALAEAYFRRGLGHLPAGVASPEIWLNNFQQAAELAPEDVRYSYYLGLVEHRLGNLDRAIQVYRKVCRSGEPFAQRAVYPLALALLQRGDDLTRDPVWSRLSEAERERLRRGGALRQRPYVLPGETSPLWQGLAALRRGDAAEARPLLEQAVRSPASTLEESLAHYYLGVVAARDEDWDEVRRHWSAARAGGLASLWLTSNLGELYHRLAEERLQEGDTEGALVAANEAVRHKPDDKRLNELTAQVYERLGYQAAVAGQWAQALARWQNARQTGEGSFRLAYNLALVYERQEMFVAAGEMWREALRRRPRSANHPDAISDEQVARLWRRAAEAYGKAGEFEEATNVYRQALKWDPDNIQARMALAEGLINNGRLEAAENELQRVLELAPDHIPALLRLGEAIAESGNWWYRDAPNRYWERVLELEPGNAHARQLLGDYYQDRADEADRWGNYEFAIHMYERALEYAPHDGHILASLGRCQFKKGSPERGRAYIQEALAHAAQDLDAYDAIILAWLEQGEQEQAWKAVEQAEAAVGSIPFEFYIHEASHCITLQRSDLAEPWLARAVEKAPADQPVMVMIGEMAVMLNDIEIGRRYLQRAVEIGQYVGQAYLMLGILATKEGHTREAQSYWRKAERIARQTQDTELRDRVALARGVFSNASGLMDFLLRNPSLLESMGPFDEDDDDEPDFFGF